MTPFLFFIGIFVVFLAIQLFVKKYVPPVYWIVILSTSLAGTAFSDYMDRSLGLGYMKGAGLLVSLLIVIFIVWYFIEPNMNVKKNRDQTRRSSILDCNSRFQYFRYGCRRLFIAQTGRRRQAGGRRKLFWKKA
ncbi:hypothetical protein OMP38_25780 [Cohnella ginsengisoli]|uniref:Uncharacterized protein n=1 Tax=Cohnella ginsengisoli TaxID=425004 RepID=A0A9X4QQL6_9BACL|nr:hypothetical protein [Cohnella ginsengisoli]MDG0793850.1 hypothetical protein [Cohnella ginsengisoli]